MQESFSYVPRAAVSKFIELCDICSLHRHKNSSVLRPLAQYKHSNRGSVTKLTQSKSSVKNSQKQEVDVVRDGKQEGDGCTECPNTPSTVCPEVTEVSTSTMEKPRDFKETSVSNDKENNDDKSSRSAS